MKKEIGSIYPLLTTYSTNKVALQKDTLGIVHYSLCREALFALALTLSDTNKHVLIPAYTCQTVITPFEEAGWTCSFYSIKKDLRIHLQSLFDLHRRENPALVLVHPYFGMDLNKDEIELLKILSQAGTKLVVDLTQCIFSSQYLPFVDFITGSYRKWFPIPDGAFLRINKDDKYIAPPNSENIDFVSYQSDAMYLRGVYFNSGDQDVKAISIRLSKMADHLAEKGIHPHRMSSFSVSLKQQQNEELIQQRRKANYTYLYNHICRGGKIVLVCDKIDGVTTVPLYFTIYVDDRQSLQHQLIEDGIYAPIIWPVEDVKVLINDDVKFIYDHLLAIPCDQRYDKQDMERVVRIINKYQS